MSAFLVVHSRFSGFLVLVCFEHEHVSQQQAPEGMGYRCTCPQMMLQVVIVDTPRSTPRWPHDIVDVVG